MPDKIVNLVTADGAVVPTKVLEVGDGTFTTDMTAASKKYAPVTKADSDLPGGVCRSLLVGTPGTANLMEPDGTIRTNVPLQAGYNPIFAKQVRSGGTASDIWALY